MSIKIAAGMFKDVIYAGTTRVSKNKTVSESWVKKEDVTEQAIAAVFEFLESECKKGGTQYFEIKYPNTKGRLIFDLGKKTIDEATK